MSQKTQNHQPVETWEKMDWSQTDVEIANTLGVTREAVLYQRKKHTNYTPRKITKINWDSVDIDSPASQVAKALKITEHDVYMRRRYLRDKQGLPSRDKRWENVDWRKPVKQIAAELKVSTQAVYDKKNKLNKSGWYEPTWTRLHASQLRQVGWADRAIKRCFLWVV